MKGAIPNIGMASLADTGQWRLTVEISADGIAAVLKNTDYQDADTLLLFRKEWISGSSELLDEVETAVYENPRILEDFATRIILTTPKSLWIPADYTEDEEFDDRFFTSVYPAEPEDISADFGAEEVCLYTLSPGLRSFLQRTLPGSRISSHITVLKEAFEKIEAEKVKSLFSRPTLQSIYVNIDGRRADIMAFRDGKLLSAASHSWVEPMDITYTTLLVAKAYDMDPAETEITVAAPGELTPEINAALVGIYPEISFIMLPESVQEQGLSFAAALAAGDDFQIIANS